MQIKFLQSTHWIITFISLILILISVNNPKKTLFLNLLFFITIFRNLLPYLDLEQRKNEEN
jgi:hypothetical protein